VQTIATWFYRGNGLNGVECLPRLLFDVWRFLSWPLGMAMVNSLMMMGKW